MKKSLIALAVAGVIAAPAAMADATLYGTVAVDYVDTELADSQVERDDSKFGIKATSQTDAGLNVTGVLETTDNFDWNLAYIAVDNGPAKIWMGKFVTPSELAETGDYSNTANKQYMAGEVDNAVGLTWNLGGEGFYAGVGSVQGSTLNGNSNNAFDGTTGLIGFSMAGFTANVGYEKLDGAETSAVKVAYDMDSLGVHAVYAQEEDAAGADVVDSWKVGGNYTMGMTTVKAFYQEDDYTAANSDADTWALGVSQNLGGGLKAYVEYTDTSVAGTGADSDALTVGAAYSF